MPLALAIVPAALALAGAGLGVAGQQKSQQALSAARSQATAKQATLQANSNAIFKKSLAGSTPEVAQQEMAKGEASRMSAWNDLKTATTPIAAALPATTTTTNPGKEAQAQSGGAASAWKKLNARAAARTGSYSDWQNQQAIKNANASQKLETQNNFARGDANLLPLELSVAGEAGDKLSGWGSMVSALGSVAGAAGGMAGGAAGAAKGASNAGSIANTPSVYAPLAGGNVPSFGTGGVAPNWANMYR